VSNNLPPVPLNHCPFCGSGTAQLESTAGSYWVSCGTCGAESGAYPSAYEASIGWNEATGAKKLDNPVVQIATTDTRLIALKANGTIWCFDFLDRDWLEVPTP